MPMRRKPFGIRRTPAGWRVYLRVAGVFKQRRFPPETPIGLMKRWREETRVAMRLAHPRLRTGTLAKDVERYLAIVSGMPTYRDRHRDCLAWVAAFGARARHSLLSSELRAQLNTWRTRYAASTVNHRRTALQHLYRVLDGRDAPNPIRDVKKFTGTTRPPRMLPRELIARVLAGMHPSRSLARLQILHWTGMRASQLKRMTPADLALRDDPPYCLIPSGKEGKPIVMPLTPEGVDAWRLFNALEAWGRFSVTTLNKRLTAACTRAGVARFSTYVLRHSFARTLREQQTDLADIQELLGHRDPRTTRIYATVVAAKLRDAVSRLR